MSNIQNKLENLLQELGVELSSFNYHKENGFFRVSLLIAPKKEQVPINTPENFSITELANGYTKFEKAGKSYVFGKMQSSIIKQLYDAYLAGSPWVYGKTLMKHSGSSLNRVGLLFSRHKDWKDLVHSNCQGLYRINI